MKIHNTLLLMFFCMTSALAQFDSGSDGSDGALTFPDDGSTINFNPFDYDPVLDPDGDSVFHFTEITIPASVTVRLDATTFGSRRVVWLSSGPIQIDGVLDLSGQRGASQDESFVAIPGAGGYFGGVRWNGSGPNQTAGQGPGGAPQTNTTGNWSSGAGAGHGFSGEPDELGNNQGGSAYGNKFLFPMLGGSGGAGGYNTSPFLGDGGAGGGALLLASSQTININGNLSADGGAGGHNGTSSFPSSGGGGSGGALRLMAQSISGTGVISALGGQETGSGGSFKSGTGSPGFIRLEAYNISFNGSIEPSPAMVTPGPVFPPTSSAAIRVVRIDGVDVAADPKGSVFNPDAAITNAQAVTVEMTTTGIPVGTILDIVLHNQTTGTSNYTSNPVSGSLGNGTATAEITFPPGHNSIYVKARLD